MVNQVKVHFRLIQDEEGYPPANVESLWAKRAEAKGGYELDNLPFFEREATLGDVVLGEEKDGLLWFEKVLAPSANSLVRIVFYDLEQVDVIRGHLKSLGCTTEYDGPHRLVAINVPPEVRLVDVQSFLQEHATAGRLDYEEPILRQ